jgi:hypothetical protein
MVFVPCLHFAIDPTSYDAGASGCVRTAAISVSSKIALRRQTCAYVVCTPGLPKVGMTSSGGYKSISEHSEAPTSRATSSSDDEVLWK